jgi:hypothetical protein
LQTEEKRAMRKLIFILLFLTATAGAQGFMPATPGGYEELCFEERCAPIRFTFLGTPEARYFILADSQLPSGWPVMGFAGPCRWGDYDCQYEAKKLAADNLRRNARLIGF